MARHVDALTAATLRDLREQWWDAEFSEFLQDTLRPRPGTRILDVGCGNGTAELALGRLRVSQLRLFAIDRNPARVIQTAAECRSHNYKLGAAAADVTRLPFKAGAFDAVFCVAVLQHVNDVGRAIAELSRVTRPGGRVLAVEPDNSARYWYSSSPLAADAFAAASRFFASVSRARGDSTDSAVGPRLSAVCADYGIEPLSVQLFPVTVTHIGRPAAAVWQARRDAVARELTTTVAPPVAALGSEYLEALDAYQRDVIRQGEHFVEIQNTMLFATVGQRTDAEVNDTREIAASARA
jgi:SAM-dependent methyltransferase